MRPDLLPLVHQAEDISVGRVLSILSFFETHFLMFDSLSRVRMSIVRLLSSAIVAQYEARCSQIFAFASDVFLSIKSELYLRHGAADTAPTLSTPT